MDHSDVRNNLSAYLDHALSEATCREIENHLSGCPSCRQTLEELSHVVDTIRQIPPIEPPPWLTARIMARVRAEAMPTPGLLHRLCNPLHIKIPLEAAALICLCITGYYLATRPAPELKTPSSAPPAVPEALRRPSPRPALSPEAVPLKSLPSPRKTEPSALPPSAPASDARVAPESGTAAPALPSPPPPGATPARPSPPQPPPSQALPAAAPDGPHPDVFRPVQESAPIRSEDRTWEFAPPQLPREKRSHNLEALPAEKAAAPLLLRLVATRSDHDRIEREVAAAGNRLGGSVLRRESTPSGRSLTVSLPAARMPDFLAGLSRLGSVTERPELSADAAGELLLTIRIETAP